jgi:hypothetical protein
MAINTQKVIVGGLAAGVVLNVIDFVTNMYILGDRMRAESDAFKPGLSEMMNTGRAIGVYIVMDFILGILLVWTYAAIRPRFGPGMKTGTYAALLFWVLGGIFYSGYLMMGMMSAGLWGTFAIVALINLLLAVWVGGRLYTEEGATV